PRSAVALAGKGKDCVRTGLDFAVYHSRKMHSEKRESGVRHRIDKIFDKKLTPWFYPVVFAPERNDPAGWAQAAGPGDMIGIKPGAIYKQTAFEYSAPGLNPQRFRIQVFYSPDFGSKEKLSAISDKETSIRFGNLSEIHDPGTRNAHRPDTLRIGLELFYLSRIEHLQAANAV